MALGGAVDDMEAEKFVFLPEIELRLCGLSAARLITIVTELSLLLYSRPADFKSM